MEGIIHYELLERILTVTAECYCQKLRRLEEAIQQKHPSRRHGVILQHDNTRPHAATMTKVAIQELDWKILPHPPYSPDLASSDYHLFRSLSPTFCAEFPSTMRHSSKIDSTTSSRPNRRISSSVGSKTSSNVGRQSCIIEKIT
jgi:histone-lysine N-methyltransferase SETMAR